MAISTKFEEQLRQMPVMKTRIKKSKDGKYLIHTTEVVTIKPMKYYEAIMQDKEYVLGESEQQDLLELDN